MNIHFYGLIGFISGFGLYFIFVILWSILTTELVWNWLDDKDDFFDLKFWINTKLKKQIYEKYDIFFGLNHWKDYLWISFLQIIGSLIVCIFIGILWLPIFIGLVGFGLIYFLRWSRRLNKKIKKFMNKMEENDNKSN